MQKKTVEILKENEWVSLYKMVDPENKVTGYVYSHETRCDGKIVSFLPFRMSEKEELEFLVRCECTPCWNLKIEPSSFTGGVEKDSNPRETAIKELREESGYVISDDELMSLGTSYGIKSSDSVYYLFTVDLTSKEVEHELEAESELEKTSYTKWMSLDELACCNDPFIGMIYLRVFSALLKLEE